MARAEASALPGTTSATSGYRADIDGLRAIAVLSVLFYHAGLPGFSSGFTGVDIFFVISGFLIGGHIYSEETAGRFSFARFYYRRAKRILPALYTVLCAVLILGLLLLSPQELQRAATEGIATLAFASNLFFWKVTNYFGVASGQRTLLMTWSLGVEEQFYILVPLIMVSLMRARQRLTLILALLAAVSLGVSIYQVQHFPASAFYLLSSRAWELLGGILTALLTVSSKANVFRVRWADNLLSILGGVLIGVSIFMLQAGSPFPGIAALPSVLGAAALLATPMAFVNRVVLSSPPLRFVGRISYSLYLWHWPLLTFGRVVTGRDLSRGASAVILLLAFGAATASYYWIEQPFRRSQTPRRLLLMRYVLTTVCLVSACLITRVAFGFGFRAPELAAEEKLIGNPHDACLDEAPESRLNSSAACEENTGRSAVAVWGDSHASALATALKQRAHASGYDFIEVAKGSCPPLAEAGRYLRNVPDFAESCASFNRAALESLRENPRVKTVLLAADWKAVFVDPLLLNSGWIAQAGKPAATRPSAEETAQIFTKQLAESVMQLQDAGKQVLLLLDVPDFEIDPLWRRRTGQLPVRQWLYTLVNPGNEVDTGRDIEREAAADVFVRTLVLQTAIASNAKAIDLKSPLCGSGNACLYRDSMHLFYADNQHLTYAGAKAALGGWNPASISVGDRGGAR